MSSVVSVAIHESQFPEAVTRDLLESLRRREINHKFHYDSVKQTEKWLALHEAYSPARTDRACQQAYDGAYEAVIRRLPEGLVELIGLGCGGGQKDVRLLQLIRARGLSARYWPVDVSAAMVMTARRAAAELAPEVVSHPFVCDLLTADVLAAAFDRPAPEPAVRLITFFGMMPNFEPQNILPKLAALVRPRDYLLLSANLAPGEDYAAGVRQILPLYDNALTREWLLTLLYDLGVESGDGGLRFEVEQPPAADGLWRVTARFHFQQPRRIRVMNEAFEFRPGESIRLFFSYRHTPALMRELLKPHGLEALEHWTPPSGEEGVFLCRRVADGAR